MSPRASLPLALAALAGLATGSVPRGTEPVGASTEVRPTAGPHAPAAPEDFGPPLLQEAVLPPHEFYFTRAIYTEGGGNFFRRWGSWATDYPKADRQFMTVLGRLVDLDLYPDANAVRLDDPELRRFPFLYALEVGRGMRLTDAEISGLRSYLDAGGFLVIDDFWGTRQWAHFEREMARVFPDRPIVELSLDHPVFRMVYDIEEILQVPNVGNGTRGGPTWQGDGYTPHVRGIFNEEGRLQVLINFNTDLGDAWEWAENPYYPLKYSTFAFEMGINMIVYAMSY